MKIFLALLFSFYVIGANCTILEVGKGKRYQRLQEAAAFAQAGDTILLFAGIYPGGDIIRHLHGNAANHITIREAAGNEVIYRGGAEAIHFSECSYISIEGLIFEQQTGNGVNVDDGGKPGGSAHHFVFKNCTWRGMNANRNNDELKMSGVDDFTVWQCSFSNGAAGGSLVDLVGCHRGVFEECVFQNAGSNSVQAKGGSSDIMVKRNKFINGGERAVNIGGSTGTAYFRPAGVNYEAKNIYVQCNIFIGSATPVAFAGAIDCTVENNTLYAPKRWAVRILQENNVAGFLPCRNNTFMHNIIMFTVPVADVINIGPNTAPETFTFSRNLWYLAHNTSWEGPGASIHETNGMINRDPMFADTISFRLQNQSPARGAGNPENQQPQLDFYEKPFAVPRSIGAVEFTDSFPD